MRSLNQYILEYLPISKLDRDKDIPQKFLNLVTYTLDNHNAESISKLYDFILDNFDKYQKSSWDSMHSDKDNMGYCLIDKNTKKYVLFNIYNKSYSINSALEESLFKSGVSLNAWLIQCKERGYPLPYELPEEITNGLKQIFSRY